MEFFYDASGLAGLKYDGAIYFYRKDAQGNIIAILNKDGIAIIKYYYDAWGNSKTLYLLAVDKAESYRDTPAPKYNNDAELWEKIANLNPFRYRSYYYYTETKLYFLQSRYYDPEVCRFISQDSVEYADPETISGLNLYAYCLNNPVMMTDETGNMPRWLKWLLGGVALVGAIVLTVVTGGAVAPLVAGFAASVLVGGFTQATITALSGGDFWDGFLDGAADGAMWGGIFSFASASIGAIKYFNSAKGAVEGTKHLTNIKAGQQFDRYGSLAGRYMTDVGTPPTKLALPATNSGIRTTLQATRNFRAYTGIVADAFGNTGGGVQYVMRYPIEKLIKKGWLIVIWRG